MRPDGSAVTGQVVAVVSQHKKPVECENYLEFGISMESHCTLWNSTQSSGISKINFN